MRHTKFTLAAITTLLVLSTGTASAKSSAHLGAPAHVRHGQWFTVSAHGGSDSFGGHPYRMCVDKQIGGDWRQQACTTVTKGLGSTRTSQLPQSHASSAQFSTGFYRISDGQLITRSPIKTVTFTR